MQAYMKSYFYPVVIFVGGLVILVLILFYSAIRDLASMLFNIPAIQRIRFGPADLTRVEGYLMEIPYYKSLNVGQQLKFRNRVITFVVNKDIIGKGDLVVTEKMKIQIAATAIQLTFGLDHWIFPHFSTIYIFHGEFGYPGKGVRMKGATTESGKLYLSWKHFTEGLLIPDDGYNLGLHELAHAVKIEYMNGVNEDQQFDRVFPEWYDEGLLVMQEMKEGRSSFLRKYAMTNPHEFFAVSVERFFETPKEFKAKLPKAYHYLSALLRQDPASNAIRVVPADSIITIPAGERYETFSPIKKTTNDSWHWSLTILLTSLFIGIPLYIWMISITEISTGGAIALGAVAGALNLITWPYFRERDILNRTIFSLYSFIGVGIWASVFIFAINYSIPISSVQHDYYRIINCSTTKAKTDSWTRYTFADDALESSPLLRTFYRGPCYVGENLRIDFRNGVFGMRTVRDYGFE
jgi:Mlc titration factor MtfA (ptsG expression regulator)